MALIKSALELALEKTKDIQVDKTGLEAKGYRETGMKLVSKFENDSDFDLKAELAKHSGQHLEWVREGMRQILTGYLGLPNGEEALNRFARVAPAFQTIASRPADMQTLTDELIQFFGQYLEQRTQLIQAVNQQLEPSMRQKEEALYQKTGRRVRVTAESEPEFAKFLNTNLDKLVGQYTQALEKVKEEILALIA